MYKSLYKWHKWIGLIISVPIILWALSGLLHPTLRLTKPVLDTHQLVQPPLPAEAIVLEPGVVLRNHGITHVKNIRIISMHDKHYYRVSRANGETEYFDASIGSQLLDGEKRYAEYLARHYLGDQGMAIINVEAVSEFSTEYAPINRFLPVWRVNFDHPDGLRLYVDTESSRLATAVDDLRAELLWWFGVLHDWSFLDKDSEVRIGIFIVVMLAMFVIGLMGILLYGLRYQCMKNANSDQARTGVAYFHRTIGLLISLTTLMFSFSGGMHVWHKLSPDDRHTKYVEDIFAVDELDVGLKQVIHTMQEQGPVKSVSLVRVGEEPYYRLVHAMSRHSGGENHAEHSKTSKNTHNWPDVSYVHSGNGTESEETASLYAHQLASRISGLNENQISSIQAITRFNHEYGFIDRRLPVAQVNYHTDGNPSYYVDPDTGRLAALVDDSRRFEKFTFRMFHKWRFADALGKNGRDGVIAVFILLNVIVIILGVMLFVSRRRRNAQR